MMFSNSMTLGAGVLLILIISLCSAAARGDGAEDCCLTTSNRRIPKRVVTTFTIQTGDGACRIPATIFVTKKGWKLCAPFPSESNWVGRLIDHILATQNSKNPKGKKQKDQ